MNTQEIFDFLRLECINKSEFDIIAVKPPDEIVDYCFTLLTRIEEFEVLFTDYTPINVLAVIPKELKEISKNKKQSFLLSDNPRLDFVKVLHKFNNKKFIPEIAQSAIINSTGCISNNIRVGENVVIKGNIDIDESTEVFSNVVISGTVKIGKNVKIKSGTIIGQKGFNFVYDERGVPLEFPHVGRVIIGNNVELGALNTVVQGTLGDTIVADDVKTDDHVHIAHNVKIGKGTLITACAEISGSVSIGENTWLGPNCSIIDHINIGNNVTVGMGAVVTKNIPEGETWTGSPAKPLKDFIELQNKLKKL